jgi:hypothetical protein
MKPTDLDTRALMLAAEVAMSESVGDLEDVDRELSHVAARRLRRVHEVAAAFRADDDARRMHHAAMGGQRRAEPRSINAIDVLERSIRLQISASLCVSASAADVLVRTAGLAIDRFPVVIDAMEAGRFDERIATVLLDAVADLDDESADEVLELAMPLAESLTPAKLQRRVMRLADRLRDEGLETRHERAVQNRRVSVEHVDDAMSWLHVLTTTANAMAIEARTTATAKAWRRAHPDEHRTLQQLRADIVADLLIDGDTDHLPDAARGIRAEVTITVPVLSLLDGDDRHGAAELHGAGPIPIETARRLAGGSSDWIRVLTHPVTGVVLDVDRTRYRPPASLRRLVKWMHGTCTAPGCSVSAARCELDHIRDWQHGGTTSLTNLHPVCEGHHTIRHASPWMVDADVGPPWLQHPNPAPPIRWRSPAGTVTTSHPEHELAPPF